MAILGGAGKELGSDAASKVQQTVKDAIPALGQEAQETVAAAGEQARGVADKGGMWLLSLAQFIRDAADGGKLPFKVTITIEGQIGPASLTKVNWGIATDTPTVTVEG